MNLTIFGAGYVGLVQATVFANIGHNVICVDTDSQKIDQLKQGISPIYEPDLQELIIKNIKEYRLKFTSSEEDGIQHSNVQFIAVGTPSTKDGSADIKQVLAVTQKIATVMTEDKIIINKSTVPIGTAKKMSAFVKTILSDRNVNHCCEIASNPEFSCQGHAVNECIKPMRIIIGADSEKIQNIIKKIYAPFEKVSILVMNTASAELTKYAANCTIASRIGVTNEIAKLAEISGADIDSVRLGIGTDSRIGFAFLNSGSGFGGSCLPKDLKEVIQYGENNNVEMPILKQIEQSNNTQKQVLFRKIKKHYKNNLTGKTFALWGLSFKALTDDMREAPSRTLIELLINSNNKIQAYDPMAKSEAQHIYANINALKLCETQQEALYGADALIICTEWKHFLNPDFTQIKEKLKFPVIFDGRNLYSKDKKDLQTLGFTYYGIGC